VSFRLGLGSQVMRADIQRKLLGFQEVTSHKYRCVSFCVTRFIRSQEMLAHSLVFKTKGFLEPQSNTSLLQMNQSNKCPVFTKIVQPSLLKG